MKQDTAADSTRPKTGIRDHCGFLRRFILFALPFWSAEHKWINRGRLALIAALTVAQVAVQVGLNSWSARLYNALEARQLDTFLEQIVTFVLLLLASIAVFSISLYVRRRLQFAWRVWLTKTTLSVWMAEGRHYQLGLIAGDHDNPDGRIAEDIRVTTESAVDLGQSLFYCILLLGTFVDVLWTLSGVVHVEIGGTVIPIPGFMVFIALTYSAIGTSLALWAGLPLVGASNLRQTVEANFRFGLARAREYSESIALIGGDADERTHLQELAARRATRLGEPDLWPGAHHRVHHGVQRAGSPVSASCRGAALYHGVDHARHADADGAGVSASHRRAVVSRRQSFQHRPMAGLRRTRDGAAGRAGPAPGETRREPHRGEA